MPAVTTVLVLVVLATVVAVLARRISVPAPSLLVVAGLVAGMLPFVPTVQVTPELISLVVLPPLLYAAGEEMPWRDLRAVWRPVTALALALVLLTALAVGVVAAAITPLPLSMGFTLGAILAATDPVAVTALGRRLPLPGRLSALVQAESLFNDATSLVLFRVAVGVAAAGSLSWGSAVGQFFLLGGGGAAIGAVLALGTAVLRRRTEDPVLETVAALVTPYLCYVVAEELHTSGVMAVVVAAVVLGAQGSRISGPSTRLQLHAVYGTVVFLLESAVFALIGLELPTLLRDSAIGWSDWLLPALVLTVVMLLARYAFVYPLSRLSVRDGAPAKVTAVVVWAGARGVVPLAAALSIPLLADDGTPLPGRDLVLLLTAAVIVITLTVQGFTLAAVVRAAGVARESAEAEAEDATTRRRLAEAALDRIEELADAEAAPAAVLDRLRRGFQAQATATTDHVHDEPYAVTYQRLRVELVEVRTHELARLYDTGQISEATRRTRQHALDKEDASLRD